MATAIAVGIGAVAFRLFHQNERLFRDQSLILEMQQSARVIVSQVADDIRIAGQGVPPGLREVILPGSGDFRLNVRASFSAAESVVVSALPLTIIGDQLTVAVESTMGFSSGRQAFLWGDLPWMVGTIDSVSGAARSIRLTPSPFNPLPLEFLTPPSISLDEAISLYWDGSAKTVRRTTATNTENAVSPSWGPANELAVNVIALNFFYYEATGLSVIPDTLEHRSEIRSIEARVVVRSSAPLSDGSRPTYALSTRVDPRNLQLR